jgi:hypothetical protein
LTTTRPPRQKAGKASAAFSTRSRVDTRAPSPRLTRPDHPIRDATRRAATLDLRASAPPPTTTTTTSLFAAPASREVTSRT